MAEDLLHLVRRFESDADVAQWETYQLLARLLAEQCDVAPPDESAPEAPSDAASPVTLKAPQDISGSSL